MRIVCVHVTSTPNVGDRFASPKHYFPWLADAEERDIFGLRRADVDGAFVILGGGGLLQADFCRSEVALLARLAAARRIRLVVWGAGVNAVGKRSIDHDALRRQLFGAALIGLRDWGTTWRWCPGVSCLSNAFDAPPPLPDCETVVYEHFEHPLGLGLPTATNAEFRSVADAAAFLARGRTVLTNTYHGAYWATLLGRPVAACEPFASRFHHMRHKPVFTSRCHRDTPTKAYPNALADCRFANERFALSVRKAVEAAQ